jgi:translation machinery-associated protein 16
LQAEQAARRKGRPKSAKENQLEEIIRHDAEEYRTGLDLPDLTDQHNVRLFRQWDGVDVTYLRILRFIRICGEFPDVIHLARIGRNEDTGAPTTATGNDIDEEMELEENEASPGSRIS